MAETTAFSERLLARYDRLIATLRPEPVERQGVTMPYTSYNGHMFSFLTKEGKLALRMPKEDIADFIKRFGGRRARQHGVVLQEYVEITDELFKKTSTLSWYFGLSWMHVSSLRPKATTRKKPAAKKVAKKKTAAKKKTPAAKKKTPAAKKKKTATRKPAPKRRVRPA